MSTQPQYDPETEGVVYHVAPTHQTESISDITSETESTSSGTTLWSDEIHEYFITHHGRQHPAGENAVRWFPLDNTRRGVLRHVVEKYLLGHNYLGPVKEMLFSPEPHHVLEIGTRGGYWVQEMATEFPHVQFRSLDVAPVTPHVPRSNIIFEVYDLSEGLLIESNSQDIVFINAAVELIKNYQTLLVEAHRVLRPGGLIHIREFISGFWDSRDDSKLASATNPIGCRYFDFILSAAKKSGAAGPGSGTAIGQWLAPDSELWKGSNEPRGFERIHPLVKTVPLYPHDGYPCASHLDPKMIPLIRHFFFDCARDSVGLLCDAGLSIEEAKQLAEAVIDEYKDPEKCSLMKLYTVYATKKGAACCK